MNWIPPEDSLIESALDPQPKPAFETADNFTDTDLISNSEEETFLIGKRIACFLKGGSTVALRGTLGSGKTCLVKGIANGLGINETITSPTYTIISEYLLPERYNSPALFHIDVYRLKNEEDFEQIGGSEIINSGGITIIEWSERIQKSLPDNVINITLEISGPFSRLIKVRASTKI